MTIDLYEISIEAPKDVHQILTMGNSVLLADWYPKLVLYCRAMQDVGRAVLLRVNEDENLLAVDSLPASITPTST